MRARNLLSITASENTNSNEATANSERPSGSARQAASPIPQAIEHAEIGPSAFRVGRDGRSDSPTQTNNLTRIVSKTQRGQQVGQPHRTESDPSRPSRRSLYFRRQVEVRFEHVVEKHASVADRPAEPPRS